MTETSFFTDGEAYERLMGRWSRAAGEVFIDWLALPPGLNWLDVGCGTGAFTELILARCAPAQVSAIDPAKDQVAYARARPGAASASFRVGDAQSLPYADNTFDVATMALVITFVPDPTKAVAEMTRATKPGGSIGTYMWDFFGKGFPQEPLRDALQAMNVTVPPTLGIENARMENLRRFFESAGLKQVATRTIEIEVSYSNFDDYWASQTGLANPAIQAIRKMPSTQVERLKDNLRKTLPTDRSGRIAYPARANALKGRVPA
jgi:ubiquinone/menaquinone biosynthesis C-methylase UbiE